MSLRCLRLLRPIYVGAGGVLPSLDRVLSRLQNSTISSLFAVTLMQNRHSNKPWHLANGNIPTSRKCLLKVRATPRYNRNPQGMDLTIL